jgi:hypothetical protein
MRERRERECGGGSERHYIWGGGGQETLSPVLKVPRQCPLVLLVEVSKAFGTLEGLHYSEILI